MEIHTIDYKKHWGQDGTVYKQTIKIDKELQEKFNNDLQLRYDRINFYAGLNKTITNADMDILTYTKKLEKGVNYLHLTGLYYFGLLVNTLGIDKNHRLLWDRNTIIEVL